VRVERRDGFMPGRRNTLVHDIIGGGVTTMRWSVQCEGGCGWQDYRRRLTELEMRPMRWRTVLALGVVVSLAAACATNRSSTPIVDPDVITTDQVVRSKATNAYDVIATLRPQMFTAHGAPTTRGQQPATPGRQALPVVVYIDNVKVGPVEELKALGKLDVREIRYLSPRVATDRWGEHHAGGVIYVTTVQAIGPDTASQ
jgi:hypothetical protein